MNLFILTNNPNRASFRQRIAIYLDTLREKGLNCEVAKLPSGSLARRQLFKKTAEFDGVFLNRKGLNLFNAFWLGKYSRKLIYDFDDAIMYSVKNPERNSWSHFIPFRRSAGLADMIIAGNSYLAQHARRFNPNVVVLPTGLDVNAYKVPANPENDGKIRLVWIGSRSTLKYLAEIKPALEQIGSRFNNAILRIVCDDFFDLKNMDVEKYQWSLEKQAVDLAASHIGLAPLPDNRFTRGKCGFKILQYEAASLPVVASPVGVNSEYVRDNVTGLFAISIQEWIEKITQLIMNPQLRKQMGKEGLVQVKNFDTGIIGKKLVELITKCLAG